MQLNLTGLQAVLFDWDNTLAESRSSLTASVNQVLREYGMPDWNKLKHNRNPDLSFRDNFPNIFKDKAAEAYQRYSEIYRKVAPQKISAFADVQNTIDFLKKCGIKTAVMTNKDRKLLEFELSFLFNASDFDKIVCGHEAPRDKPFPEQVFYTLEGLVAREEINKQTVWVVGDSKQDSDSALAAGVLPIRIGHPIWNDENFRDNRIIFFKNFSEFLASLRNIK